jgi:hypothetical protein
MITPAREATRIPAYPSCRLSAKKLEKKLEGNQKEEIFGGKEGRPALNSF